MAIDSADGQCVATRLDPGAQAARCTSARSAKGHDAWVPRRRPGPTTGACTLVTVQPLTRLEKSVLDFERVLWNHIRAKEEAIRKTFDVSPARYFQFLAVIIRKDAALDHDPLLVRRLRRLRDRQIDDQRSASTSGSSGEERA